MSQVTFANAVWWRSVSPLFFPRRGIGRGWRSADEDDLRMEF